MSTHKSDNDDSDDPVVSEFPVYHSTRLKDNLYVFQYKDDITLKIRDGEMKEALFKPENQELKFKIGPDVYESLDVNTNDLDENEERLSIQAKKNVDAPELIAVAAFNGKEVHLNAVKNVFTLGLKFERPLKPSNKKKAENSEDEAGPSTATQVTVKFKQTPRPNQKQITSYKSYDAKIASEKWVECELHTPDSAISKEEKHKLFTEYLHDTNEENNLDESTYFKHIVQGDQEEAKDTPSLPSHLISLNALRALPLIEQCRLLLKGSQIVPFQQIQLLLAGCSGLTTDSLLKTLPEVAVLVRGNWVVKSEVLYPPKTFSPIYGVPSENMCIARDYLLYLFTKHQSVNRKKVTSEVSVPAEEVKEIFKGISSLRHNKGWELNLDPDVDFIEKYPDVEKRQSLLWEQKFIQIRNFLKEKRRRKSRSESKSISEDKKSGHYSSDYDSGAEKTKSPLRKKKKTAHPK